MPVRTNDGKIAFHLFRQDFRISGLLLHTEYVFSVHFEKRSKSKIRKKSLPHIFIINYLK